MKTKLKNKKIIIIRIPRDCGGFYGNIKSEVIPLLFIKLGNIQSELIL
nr:MAG TPA: hypothetical protein [Caudoviricetes sp.]